MASCLVACPACIQGSMKYILVTGGVISGIGKGIIASSVGTILKSCGLHVTAIKIDPYINIDAGTFSPYEHGDLTALAMDHQIQPLLVWSLTLTWESNKRVTHCKCTHLKWAPNNYYLPQKMQASLLSFEQSRKLSGKYVVRSKDFKCFLKESLLLPSLH